MEHYGVLSIVPILATLTVAFRLKNVFIALLSGVLTASVIVGINTKHYLIGFESIASVFTSVSSAKTIFFILLSGGIMNVVSASGGVEGLIVLCTEKQKIVKSRKAAQLISFILGMLLFVDATSSIVVISLVGKPFFTKYNIPKEKLALIANSTGSAVAWLMPFGAGCAFLTGILAGVLKDVGLSASASAFSIVLSSVKFQFYNIFLLIIVFVSIVTGFEKGKIKEIVDRKNLQNTDYIYATDIPKGKKACSRNMIVPIVTLVSSIFAVLFLTGHQNIFAGDAATAVFVGGIVTIILTGAYYLFQRIASLEGYIKWCFDGMKGMFEIAAVLVLAFAFGSLLSKIGTANYLATFTHYIPTSAIIVASLLFAVLISYSTGSSGAAVALLVPIVVPVAYNVNIPIAYVLGAIVSGAVVGDQNSPISDSVILTSTSTDVEVMSHLATQMPYTSSAFVISIAIYSILGFTL